MIASVADGQTDLTRAFPVDGLGECESCCGGEVHYYFNARWYDPQMGRFLTEDPARDGENWYAYVGNNPLARIDPTGLDAANPGKSELTFSALNPLQQEWFDKTFGFGGSGGSTASCQTSALFNIYAATTSGGLGYTALARAVAEARSNDSIRAEGSVGDLAQLSKAAASALGRSTYYDRVYPAPARLPQTMSEEEFASSTAPAGIAELYNSDSRLTHYIAEVHTPAGVVSIDSLDPNRPAAAGYEVTEIRTLQLLPLTSYAH